MEALLDENYNLFGSQHASEEPYYHAGTHRLPQSVDNLPSAAELEEEVDAGLLSLNPNPGFSNVPGIRGIDSWTDGLIGQAPQIPSHSANQPGHESQFASEPPRRTNSGLNAAAPPFFPSGLSWQNTQVQNIDRTNHDSLIPSRGPIWTQLTPLQTNFGLGFPPTPDSNPYNIANASAIPFRTPPWESPLAYRAPRAYPQTSSSSILHGYQWNSDTPPAQDISTWAQQSYGPTRGTIGEAAINPTMLTPTPTTPTQGGSALERTTSRTATSAMFACNYEGCDKEFKSRTEFTHHRRNHGERTHICPECGKGFIFHKDLKRHANTHRPHDKNFFCTHAGCPYSTKGFQRKDHYKRHLETHNRSGILTPSSAPLSRSASHQ